MLGSRMSAALLVIACSFAHSTRAQDVQDGKRVFLANCSICHTVQPDRNLVGPTLFGVVNRHAGEIPGFHYSMANRQSGLTWDPQTLDRYLAAPRKVVPGTLMTFPGLKDPEKRADVIAFLGTLH
jgi:cytochrome c2